MFAAILFFALGLPIILLFVRPLPFLGWVALVVAILFAGWGWTLRHADPPPFLLAPPLALWALAASQHLVPRKEKPPAFCCQACGYDLTGNTSGVCPECGKKL